VSSDVVRGELRFAARKRNLVIAWKLGPRQNLSTISRPSFPPSLTEGSALEWLGAL
jgi:hypothetical protein